ncbi:heat-inducible transcriptional repressor HrcA [Prochlorothrix hollandica]|uniref:heat-inducible transcriptional repressor HrcA n=1 Tax=Prochlorothrix hollandica TaxID=1223 RepID=UPI00333EC2C3
MQDISSVSLTQRQAQVLQATVRHYIATAEPVGSKALTQEYDFSVSSATIRSTMGALEKAGFLYQPYTSAGRIPSDSGYRTYVDQLLVPSVMRSQHLSSQFHDQLRWDNGSLESVLRRAAQILSGLSGYMTLITLPQTSNARLRHLQLVPVEGGQIMLIVVTSTYETRSTLLKVPHPPEDADRQEEVERELQILTNFLNSRLRGKLLQELAQVDWHNLERELQGYADSLQRHLVDLSQHLLKTSTTTQLVISGMSELLHQPEFSELQQVQALIHLLEEEQDQLWSVMFAVEAAQDTSSGARTPDLNPKSSTRFRIHIGSENPLEPMRGCSLVSAMYRRDGQLAGSVGILGPTRMVYEQAIVAVEVTADYLSEALSSESLGGNGDLKPLDR